MVIFMDAYDVLVFPAIVKAAAVLAQSPTPIMFCAERGVYPEMPGFFYLSFGFSLDTCWFSACIVSV